MRANLDSLIPQKMCKSAYLGYIDYMEICKIEGLERHGSKPQDHLSMLKVGKYVYKSHKSQYAELQPLGWYRDALLYLQYMPKVHILGQKSEYEYVEICKIRGYLGIKGCFIAIYMQIKGQGNDQDVYKYLYPELYPLMQLRSEIRCSPDMHKMRISRKYEISIFDLYWLLQGGNRDKSMKVKDIRGAQSRYIVPKVDQEP